jgi:hypothetical protein
MPKVSSRSEKVKKKAPKKSAPKPKAPKKSAPKPKAPKKSAPKPKAPKKSAPKPKAPKKSAPKPKAAPKKQRVPKRDAAMCDEDCNLRAKWRVESHTDPDGDYYNVCNQHLGKVCEKIVKTSDTKYDIVYLKET